MMLPSKHIQKTALAVALSVSLFACGGSDNDDDGPAVQTTQSVTVDAAGFADGETISVNGTSAVIAPDTKIFVADEDGNDVEIDAATIESVAVTVDVATNSASGTSDEAGIQTAINEAIDEADADASLTYDSVVNVVATVTAGGVPQTVTTLEPPVTVTVPFETQAALKLKAGCGSYKVINAAGQEMPFETEAAALKFTANKSGKFKVFGVNCPSAGEGESN
ncbi:MAG: hypothetical protein CMF25_07535 [Kangiellaceae bacterium]|nr:hypothetical protein [Kangiellaceae bacterium]|tara:strand:+ start:1517 stop:2182 length:666 start_codon:yes stop_codon:yes gene_type:complete